jgi:hypothetical protein
MKKFTSLMLSAMAVAALSSPLAAQTATAPTIVTDQIGGQTMNFAIRPGECALDRKHPVDKRLIDQTEALIVNSNFLHVITADCKQLADWRSLRVMFLTDGMQIQSLKAAANQNLRGQEKAVVDAVCNQFRTNAGDVSKFAENEVRDRIEQSKATIKLESFKLIGVMGQDDRACYVAARVAGKSEIGTDTIRMMVFGTLVLSGKLVYMYRYSDRQDHTVLKDLMADLDQDIRRQIAANPK